ncbi:MAG: cupin domain-containing protein [Flavobacteriales bacterium]
MEHYTDLHEVKYFKPIRGLKAKIVNTNNQTCAFWKIKEGTVLPAHQHIHKQISIVTKGVLELTIDKEIIVMKKGMMAIIPSQSLHSARAMSDVELTDIFDPIREGFLT